MGQILSIWSTIRNENQFEHSPRSVTGLVSVALSKRRHNYITPLDTVVKVIYIDMQFNHLSSTFICFIFVVYYV